MSIPVQMFLLFIVLYYLDVKINPTYFVPYFFLRKVCFVGENKKKYVNRFLNEHSKFNCLFIHKSGFSSLFIIVFFFISLKVYLQYYFGLMSFQISIIRSYSKFSMLSCIFEYVFTCEADVDFWY